ncbi:MAG: hypothetical protein WA902_20750 [Thermosynechococcaceae cyanobacterium]
MQHLVEVQSESKRTHWLDAVEGLSVVGAIGGAIASAVTQQVVFASIPLSLTATLHFINRRRLDDITGKVRQLTIEQIIQQGEEHQQHISALTKQLQVHQQALKKLDAKLASVEQHGLGVSQQAQELREQDQQREIALQRLAEIEQLTQSLWITPQNAKLYYRRGSVRGRESNSEDLQLAIHDYTQAIELDATYADAYFQRGALKGKVGEKKQAVADLRVAAKLYFDAGNLESSLGMTTNL